MDEGSEVNLPSGWIDKRRLATRSRGSFERALSLESLVRSLFTFRIYPGFVVNFNLRLWYFTVVWNTDCNRTRCIPVRTRVESATGRLFPATKLLLTNICKKRKKEEEEEEEEKHSQQIPTRCNSRNEKKVRVNYRIVPRERERERERENSATGKFQI